MSVLIDCNNNKPVCPLFEGTNKDFLASIVGKNVKWEYLSRQSTWRTPLGAIENPCTSMIYQAVHAAFQVHHNLRLTPDIFWYMIVSQVAMEVKQDPKMYGFLFNGDPDQKRKVVVRDDSLVLGSRENDWGSAIGLFEEALKREMNPQMVDLFVPAFSTTTEEDRVAVLVAFMDVVSKYFDYEVQSYCGIPRYELVGTPEDYTDLLTRAMKLRELFPNMESNFWRRVIPDLEKIKATAEGDVDINFWNSCYQYDSMSGSEIVSGWLMIDFAAFFVSADGEIKPNTYEPREDDDGFILDGVLLKNLPKHLSVVNFVFDYNGTKYDMAFVAGGMGMDFDGSWITPRLGFGVFMK